MSMTVLVGGGLLLATFLIYWFFNRAETARDVRGTSRLSDLAGLGDVVPDSIYPRIDEAGCIGSGACVSACPEKGILTVINGVVKLTNPMGCVGHGACERACPVDAIKLVFGSETRGVELPQVDPNFETPRKGVYVIGELGGMGLIKNAVSQGRQAAEHVVSTGRRGQGDALDAIIVGAGPAGISATLALLKAGYNVLALEREKFGGAIMHYPRAKVVMTGSLDFAGFGKVRQKKMSKEELVAVWDEIRAQTNPPVVEGELVESIEPDSDGAWRVISSTGVRRAANVLLALGRRGSPRKLGVPGEESSKVAYRVIEPEAFTGQHVLVVGGGNSAVETALALANQGRCASVGISYRRGEFNRCRGDNKLMIHQAIDVGRVEAFLGTTVQRIEDQKVWLEDKNGKEFQVPNDSVVVQIGGTPPGKVLGAFNVDVVTKYGDR